MKGTFVLAAFVVFAAGGLSSCSDRASRDEFRRDMQSKLDQLDVKIEDLARRARDAGDDAKPKIDSLIDDLKARRQRAAEKLRQVSDATDDSWKRFKDDAKSAIDDLSDTVERGWHEFMK